MFATSRMLSKAVKGKLKASDYYTTYGQNANNFLAEEEEEYRITRSFMTDAYRVNPWIRSIVDLTKERADQVDIFPIPLSLKRGSDPSADGDYSDSIKRKIENVMNLMMVPNDDYESFSSLKKKVFGDILVYDEAGMQIVRGTGLKGNRPPVELRSTVSGEELYVNAKRNGKLRINDAYVQVRGQNILARWSKYDFMNFIKNMRAGRVQGFSPIESTAASILADIESTNYNLKFFQNNARPNLAFLFNNLGFGPGQTALERAKKWYYSEHRGRPHLPLFMGTSKGEVKLQTLSVANKDMEFSNWQLMLLSHLMANYGMQPMVLGVLTDTTGKLNSEVQTEQYKKNAIIPLIKVFLNVFNSVLVWGDRNLNYDDIYVTSANLDIDDEKKQAEIWDIFLRDGVITINQVRQELQMAPVPWGEEPFVPLNMSPLDILREYQESRIEANRKSAMDSGIDNNVDGDGKKGDDKRNGNNNKDGVKSIDDFLNLNYGLRTGLEKADPTLVIDAAKRLIKKRESRSRNFDYGNIHKVSNGMGLSWQNILKKR